ncbi:MAG: chorismate synthase [Bdellovibrionaceae bacterium]|nr:chorismate synthase [Pseudobdellovibrionaceae bacterium]
MGGSTFGRVFQIHSFGESHGKAMGVVIDGCPSGVKFSLTQLQEFVNRRRPGFSPFSSKRKEADQVELLSGVYEGYTLGTPIALLVYNQDARSSDYDEIKKKPRPGHADDVWKVKYKHTDHRGGGRASARETLSRVMAGAVAKMLIQSLQPKLNVFSFIKSIGLFEISSAATQAIMQHPSPKKELEKLDLAIPDKECLEKVKKLLGDAGVSGESYGGVVQLVVRGLPAGLGQPVFHKLKADLALALLSIGSTVGLEFGDGFKISSERGSEFHSLQQQHNYAGLRGGISTGEAMVVKIAFKPVSSVGAVARNGRHDPCVLQRALPIVESMVLLSIADHLLSCRLDKV